MARSSPRFRRTRGGATEWAGIVRLLLLRGADRRPRITPPPVSAARTDRTHEAGRRSWVESANGHPEFPIQNLPLGVFHVGDDEDEPRIGMAIGDSILDLVAAHDAGFFGGLAERAAERCAAPALNQLMALGRAYWRALREQAADLLDAGSAAFRDNPRLGDRLLLPRDEAELLLPARVGDYTDFYASVHHATNVGSMFRPDNPLLPNYKWVPIGYHGRSSSIVPSGTSVRRPAGQRKDPASETPEFGPARQLDYEMELGCFVSAGNSMGEPVPIAEAEEHLFGLCLVNDWSARDIQSWEYQPLGPFLAKNFATSISPWIVTWEALEPYRVPAFFRPPGDPAPFPYLSSEKDKNEGGVAITLEVRLSSLRMRDEGHASFRVSRGSFASMYWTLAQMLTHHTSNGCNLR